MRKIIKLFVVFIMAFNLSCDNSDEACRNQNVGKDSLSCEVNGKSYTPCPSRGKGGGLGRAFSWSYRKWNFINNAYLFNIRLRGKYTMTINVINPKLGKNILNQSLNNMGDTWHTGMIVITDQVTYNTRNNEENGYLMLTELSSERAVGTFECKVYNKAGEVLNISRGSFDLSLDTRRN